MKRPAARRLPLLCALGIFLTACGGSPTPDDGTPAPPTNVTATPGPGYITVSWEHDGEHASGFIVYREIVTEGLQALALERIAEVPANERSYRDSSIKVGKRYSYQVTAQGSGGESVPERVDGPARVAPAFEVVIGTYSIDHRSLPEPVTTYLILVDEEAMPSEDVTVSVTGPEGWNGGEVRSFTVSPQSLEGGWGIYAALDIPIVTGTYEASTTVGGSDYLTTSNVEAEQVIATPTPRVEAYSSTGVTASWEAVSGARSYLIHLLADDLRVVSATTTRTEISLEGLELMPAEYTVRVFAQNFDATAESTPERPYPQFNFSLGFSEPFVIPYDDGTFYKIDPEGAYLPRDPDDTANPATSISLQTLSVAAGQCLGLMRSGSYSARVEEPGTLPDDSTSMTGVFRDPSGFVAPGEAGNQEGIATRETAEGLTTDIPEDFWVPGRLIVVQVPENATELLFSPNDSYHGDNGDSDSDYGILIGEIACSEAASIGLEPAPGGAVTGG